MITLFLLLENYLNIFKKESKLTTDWLKGKYIFVNPDKIQVLVVKRNYQLLATCPLDSTCEKPILRKVKNFLRST